MPLSTQVTVRYDITAEHFFNLFCTFIEHNSFSRCWVKNIDVSERLTQFEFAPGDWRDKRYPTSTGRWRRTWKLRRYYDSAKSADGAAQVWARDWRVRIDIHNEHRGFTCPLPPEPHQVRAHYFLQPSDFARVARLNPELFWRWVNPDDTTFDVLAADSVIQTVLFGKEVFG